MSKISVEKLSADKKKDLGLPDSCMAQGPWSVWECEPSTFNWQYADTEQAFVYEGKVEVVTAEETVAIHAGDFVIFPKGLSCTWKVIEKIRKVYQFT